MSDLFSKAYRIEWLETHSATLTEEQLLNAAEATAYPSEYTERDASFYKAVISKLGEIRSEQEVEYFQSPEGTHLERAGVSFVRAGDSWWPIGPAPYSSPNSHERMAELHDALQFVVIHKPKRLLDYLMVLGYSVDELKCMRSYREDFCYRVAQLALEESGCDFPTDFTRP